MYQQQNEKRKEARGYFSHQGSRFGKCEKGVLRRRFGYRKEEVTKGCIKSIAKRFVNFTLRQTWLG
jgi:hypothetical protein